MERLTNKREADAQRIDYENRRVNGYPRNIPEERFLRLAAYEDTGLMPEDLKEHFATDSLLKLCGQALGVRLDRLRELAKADKEGLVVVLPCKVGDVMWSNIALRGDRYRESDKPYPVCVTFYGFGENSAYLQALYSSGRNFPFDFDRIGKTIFTTREEAEAALKED